MWYLVREGLEDGSLSASVTVGRRERPAYRREIVMRVMPFALSASYMEPSTSLDTALVHSVHAAT